MLGIFTYDSPHHLPLTITPDNESAILTHWFDGSADFHEFTRLRTFKK